MQTPLPLGQYHVHDYRRHYRFSDHQYRDHVRARTLYACIHVYVCIGGCSSYIKREPGSGSIQLELIPRTASLLDPTRRLTRDARQ